MLRLSPGMELDGVEAVRLFKLLDADGNGSIEIDEQLNWHPWALTRWDLPTMTKIQETPFSNVFKSYTSSAAGHFYARVAKACLALFVNLLLSF